MLKRKYSTCECTDIFVRLRARRDRIQILLLRRLASIVFLRHHLHRRCRSIGGSEITEAIGLLLVVEAGLIDGGLHTILFLWMVSETKEVSKRTLKCTTVIAKPAGFVAGVRRLSLPFVSTAAAIGVSMFAGDFACQFIQHNADRKRLVAQHTAAVVLDPTLPAPDFDSLLAAPSHSEHARVPLLPSFVREWMPRWWNADRGLAMLATGTLAGGPWQFTIQRTAEHFFPGRTLAQIGKKMAVNMGTAPIGISSTFYLTNFFQGGTHDTAVTRIKRDVGSTFVTGFFYWPFVSFVNLVS